VKTVLVSGLYRQQRSHVLCQQCLGFFFCDETDVDGIQAWTLVETRLHRQEESMHVQESALLAPVDNTSGRRSFVVERVRRCDAKIGCASKKLERVLGILKGCKLVVARCTGDVSCSRIEHVFGFWRVRGMEARRRRQSILFSLRFTEEFL
jgi:hypothetical protein